MRAAEISELEANKKDDTSFDKIKRLARVLGKTPNDLAGKEFSGDPQAAPRLCLLW